MGHHSLLGFEAAAGAHGFEHLSHLGVLAEEVVDLPDGGSGAAGDALAAASVDDLAFSPSIFQPICYQRGRTTSSRIGDLQDGLRH